MGFKSFFTVASKQPENGKARLENQHLKTRNSFVQVSSARHVSEKRVRRKKLSTEQLVPSKKGSQLNSCFSILKRNVLNEDIHLRCLLLSPFSSNDAMPCEKSIIDACSQTGSVTIEMVRLSGAADHHFQLYVTADEGSAHVILPSKFRGVIHIESARDLPIQLVCSAELRLRIEEGAVRLNAPDVRENEDEVFIHAGKTIQLQMEAEQVEREHNGFWTVESVGLGACCSCRECPNRATF